MSRSSSSSKLYHSGHDFDEPIELEPRKAWYDTSAGFLWIGDRTRQLDGAHLEFFRGVRNPIGIKVGPSMKGEELVDLLDIVNPTHELGRVTLVCRYGANKVEDLLTGHIKAVQQSSHADSVVWVSDPMHGNAKETLARPDIRTRFVSDIVSELASVIEIHQRMGTRLGGVHLEMTGELNEGCGITECVGGSMQMTEQDLKSNFTSHCDPRLNKEQSLDVAFFLAQRLKSTPRRDGRTQAWASTSGLAATRI